MPTAIQSSSGATRLPVERRFPLGLSSDLATVRKLYDEGKTLNWEPLKDLDWKSLGAGDYDDATREAARAIWSRRAWTEYTALAETPALLIRFCLETDREVDPKYFLTVRNTEEAWHVECFHRLAEAFGGYLASPAQAAWEPVFNQRLYRVALDADR